ncbi:hypothetical protein T261_1465 [Streptomyces lydicus]|nr:hypothetical protein T261_1465 [Streptomyces lydicus]
MRHGKWSFVVPRDRAAAPTAREGRRDPEGHGGRSTARRAGTRGASVMPRGPRRARRSSGPGLRSLHGTR